MKINFRCTPEKPEEIAETLVMDTVLDLAYKHDDMAQRLVNLFLARSHQWLREMRVRIHHADDQAAAELRAALEKHKDIMQ